MNIASLASSGEAPAALLPREYFGHALKALSLDGRGTGTLCVIALDGLGSVNCAAGHAASATLAVAAALTIAAKAAASAAPGLKALALLGGHLRQPLFHALPALLALLGGHVRIEAASSAAPSEAAAFAARGAGLCRAIGPTLPAARVLTALRGPACVVALTALS